MQGKFLWDRIKLEDGSLAHKFSLYLLWSSIYPHPQGVYGMEVRSSAPIYVKNPSPLDQVLIQMQNITTFCLLQTIYSYLATNVWQTLKQEVTKETNN